MSSKASQDSINAMHDADRHNNGDNSSHAKEQKIAVHEHTKPLGDLRAVVDKEESGHNQRGEFNRGH